MKVYFRKFGMTYGWSERMPYYGESTSWYLIGDKRVYRGGAVVGPESSAPEYSSKAAWRAVYRLRRMGFKAEFVGSSAA